MCIQEYGILIPCPWRFSHGSACNTKAAASAFSFGAVLSCEILDFGQHEKGVVLEYQLQNTVENLADVSTRCSGLLRPEEGQNIWSKRRQGFQPCFEAGIRELPLSYT